MYYGEIENDAGDCLSPVIFPQNGEFQKLHSILVDGGDRFGVSSVTIDLQEELIWMGNQGGHVTSYYGNNLEKYTSFQVHATQEIRQILTCDEFILILTQGQLRGQLRRGLSVFNHSSEHMQEMQCMILTTPSTVLMGGHQSQLVEFDLASQTQTNTIQLCDAGCAILRSQGRLICTGEPTGEIHIYDSRTFRKEQTLEGHSGSLSDFDVHGNLLVTCGFSTRHGNLSVDRFLKVYDLRQLRALAPIPVSIDPFLLRFLPSFSSRIATVSPSGQMEILETQAVSQANICLYQVTSNASVCSSFDVSSSCHQMAFGDSTGSLHLFSSNPTAMFNSFSRDTEFPDPVETFPPMSFTDEFASFATIPLVFTNTPLLSDWPPEFCYPTYRRALPIDPTIMQSMKMVGTIGYAPNPGTFRRNQMQYKLPESNNLSNNNVNNNLIPTHSLSPIPPQNKNNYYSGGKPNSNSTSPNPGQNIKHHQFPQAHSPHSPQHQQLPQPPFFYQQPPPQAGPRPFYHKPTPIYMKNTFYGSTKRPGFHYNRYHIPKRYARHEWKKNCFEENDMEAFNRTSLSGLEATQANAYCNAILQILYHIDYLRVSLLSHLCEKEACLSCELGFLFHMLDQSKCIPAVASNFLRAFRLVPEASALGLILQESQSKQRGIFLRLIQSFNRFILHQIETETGKSESENLNSEADPISTLFSMRQENINRCTRCGREETKESTVLLSNLLYSPDATAGGKRCRFIELIQRSLSPEQTTPAWCDKCEKYQPTFQSRVPKAFPPFLSFNACLDNAHDFQTWRNHLESLLPEKGGKSDVEPPVVPGRPQAVPGPPAHVKSCRYGRNCMRPDCKFWHEGRGPKIEHAKMTEFDLNPEMQVKWLPMNLRTLIEDGRRVRCLDTENAENIAPLPEEKIQDGSAADYELVSVVCFVRDPDSEERNNLVSLIRVNQSYLERAAQVDQKSNWFIFNDFCIREVNAVEAVSFNPKWKIPCVLYYQKKESQLPDAMKIIPPVRSIITEEFFKTAEYQGKGKEGQNQKVTYKPLTPDEIPKKGQLVAMDAEFVTLGQEETELRSDGKIATVKPQQMTVARVTCIRGQGQQEGTPFIDDYISTQEVVVDYLTKFSGIKPGDLDFNFSSKNVTLLKTVYLKLRYLIDSGVKFVGHGLSNDFRVINLVVPPAQVVDTVSLFFIPNQRMISLRFLAWHFLGLSIQSEVHDSTEDARAALLLYRKYEELKKSGELDRALEGLYEAGKKAQWKVPSESSDK